MMKTQLAQSGFTLIELIITMVVMAVLAVGSVQFVSFSANAYVQTVQRTHHSAAANIINEKISRALRNALPNSVRVFSSGQCVEWIPVLSASEYIQAPIIGSPFNDGQIHMIPIDGNLPATGYVAIAPTQNETVFDNTRNPGVITASPAVFNSTVNDASVYDIPAGFRFEFESPASRSYFVSTPQSICQVSDQLFQYANYGFIANSADLTANFSSSLPNRMLLANDLVSGSLVFVWDAGSLRRSSLLSLSYAIRHGDSDETLTIHQEVQIRNVP